jgi:hypothetical protein
LSNALSKLAHSDGALAINSEVIVALVLSYLIPAIHHIRRECASLRKRRHHASAFRIGITDFSPTRPQLAGRHDDQRGVPRGGQMSVL